MSNSSKEDQSGTVFPRFTLDFMKNNQLWSYKQLNQSAGEKQLQSDSFISTGDGTQTVDLLAERRQNEPLIHWAAQKLKQNLWILASYFLGLLNNNWTPQLHYQQ